MGQDSARIRFRACLGRGGFGEVYRATLIRSGGMQADVAVKVLRQDVDSGSQAVKRLRDEGRMLGALRHPAILHVHDLAFVAGRVALITEYVDGEDLDRLIRESPPIPVRALLSVVGEIASALDAAWTTPTPSGRPIQLVHRDIKPSNIRVGRHGQVKLLDFGIARATNVLREAQTANNAMMGSYLYMAPERYLDGQVAPASDVYSLGCVLYEGLARERLFEGVTLKAIYNTMTQPGRYDAFLRDRLAGLTEGTGNETTSLVRDLLRAEPTVRPTAAEAGARLEDLSERGSGPSLKRWVRSRRWAPQVHVPGSLDGQELPVEQFRVREREAPVAVEPPPPTPREPPPPLLQRPTSGALAERRTVPAPGRPERPTVPATPVPHPSTRSESYQWIEQPEMPDPIPGVLGDVRGSPRTRPDRARPRRGSRFAAVSAGVLLAVVVLGGLGAVFRKELTALAREQGPRVEAWLRGVNAGSLNDRAWEAVDADDLDRALALFDEVLVASSRDAEALLGRGSVLLRQGRRREATDSLCAAQRFGDATIQEQATTLLEGSGVDCP